MKTPVMISAKFTGPALFRDTQNGVFWEVLPSPTALDDRLQESFIGHGSRVAQVRNEINALCHNRSQSPKPLPVSAASPTSATPPESSGGTSSTN